MLDKFSRFDRLDTLRSIVIKGHAAYDNPNSSILRKLCNRRYVRFEIAGAYVRFAGHCVFVERVGYRDAYSLVAYIKGNGSFRDHVTIISQNPPSVYRL